MSQGHYSVIRCIPDPARGELFNVGATIWSKGSFLVTVDPTAAKRASQENPNFAANALSDLDQLIRSELQRLDPITTTKFKRLRQNHRGILFSYSEPQFISIPKAGLDPMSEALESIMQRMVRPQSVRAEAEDESGEKPAQLLRDRILPLISSGKVNHDHRLNGTKTGHPRRVDFFLPSRSRIAIDVLDLDTKNTETAMKRADLEAFKIFDVTDPTQISEFYVLLHYGRGDVHADLVDDPRRAITSVQGKLLRDMNEAVEIISRNAA